MERSVRENLVILIKAANFRNHWELYHPLETLFAIIFCKSQSNYILNKIMKELFSFHVIMLMTKCSVFARLHLYTYWLSLFINKYSQQHTIQCKTRETLWQVLKELSQICWRNLIENSSFYIYIYMIYIYISIYIYIYIYRY